MNDRRLNLTSVPAPRTFEIASAQVDHAAAANREREYSVSLAGGRFRTIKKPCHAQVALGIGLEFTQPDRQRQPPLVLELQKERLALRSRQPQRSSPERALSRVSRVGVRNLDVRPVVLYPVSRPLELAAGDKD